MKKIAVLISNAGTGTNLQAIMDAIKTGQLNAQIKMVISGSPKAYGLIRAKKNNIPICILKPNNKGEEILKKVNPDYIILTGWKRIIPESVINQFPNRILNIHPGLIPDALDREVKNPDGTGGLWNKGKMTDVAIGSFLDAKSTYAGSSIHFLTHEFDFGPVQGRCFERILPRDSVESLYSRLKKKENDLYVSVLKKLCNQEKIVARGEPENTMKKNKFKYALISVFDKTGISEFAEKLVSQGYTIISTGGTAKVLKEKGIKITPIEEITGNPESFDGRMKTISFQIESGILYKRDNPSHLKQAKDLHIPNIEMVVCNLYPFEKTVQDKNVSLSRAIENIDVGGPTMIRAAAKNFKDVLVVVDPRNYPLIGEALTKNGINLEIRKQLSAEAFAHLSFYDAQIASFLNSEKFPREHTLPGRKERDLRYGENPHQKAALYFQPNTLSPLSQLKKHAGRELSLINITDINAGIESLQFFQTPGAVVIKHNTPCGIALGETGEEALKRAIEADPESAYGGVIILNTACDKKTALEITKFKDERRGNIDIVAVPEMTTEALHILTQLRKTMGIYTFGKIGSENFSRNNVKWIQGGFILQEGDSDIEKSFKSWEVVTSHKPSPEQIRQAQIAWKFILRIPSNAVIVVDSKLPMTRGIGSRQTSRVRSTRLALEQAKTFTKSAILASDSFFPFDDSVRLAAKYGIGLIVQQGDSINDALSVAAANEKGIPMIFTHRRAFWH